MALSRGVALHARPAGKLVLEANRFHSAISLTANGRRADAKSILEVLSLGAVGGTELHLTASGADAVDAVTRLASLIEAWARGEQSGSNAKRLVH
jgi:phosphotransferase system HPr (HPr) family protein